MKPMTVILAALVLAALPVAADDLPQKKFLPVREYAQKYPLSCEAAATSVVLQYLGLKTTEDEVLAAIPYDKTPKSVAADGAVTWGDPNQGFVGDYDGVYLKTGYGIYAAPLAQAVQKFGVSAKGGPGWQLGQLLTSVAAGVPVVVWVPTRFEQVVPKTWKTPAGTTVNWIDHEHAMVFCGYDQAAGEVTLMDVHTGRYQTRTVGVFLRGWGYLGNQAAQFTVR
jgi:uncharacterized protein YvpB